jgi:hypothetical protein
MTIKIKTPDLPVLVGSLNMDINMKGECVLKSGQFVYLLGENYLVEIVPYSQYKSFPKAIIEQFITFIKSDAITVNCCDIKENDKRH